VRAGGRVAGLLAFGDQDPPIRGYKQAVAVQRLQHLPCIGIAQGCDGGHRRDPGIRIVAGQRLQQLRCDGGLRQYGLQA
jgi:hypothetical protein